MHSSHKKPVADSIGKFDMDSNFNEEIMKNLDECDYIHGKHMNLVKVLSQS